MTIPTALRLAALLLPLAIPLPAAAQELAVSLGAVAPDDGEAAPALAVELRAAPFAEVWGTAVAATAGAEIDGDGDLWIGAGLFTARPLTENWRLEGSLMPGYYERGDGTDLGGNLQFRSAIALSRRLGAQSRLGLGLSHKSNAGIEDRNPGENAIFLSVARRF